MVLYSADEMSVNICIHPIQEEGSTGRHRVDTVKPEHTHTHFYIIDLMNTCSEKRLSLDLDSGKLDVWPLCRDSPLSFEKCL